MTTANERLKQVVKQTYGEIATQDKSAESGGCCDSSCGCGNNDGAVMAEDYSQLEGYVADADLGLGCGLPTQHALIKDGDIVVDLGSGAGNDAFVARSLTGASGKVIGVDFTDKMIERARINVEKLGFNNVEFRLGDIENLPISENVADVVISNCVLNLVPDKHAAFAETFRILKPGGHFSVSDIVVKGKLPHGLLESAEMYAGCISGAIEKDSYLDIVKNAGFTNIKLQKEKRITIPVEILSRHLTEPELARYNESNIGIFSITVYAEKPGGQERVLDINQTKKEACCDPGCCNN